MNEPASGGEEDYKQKGNKNDRLKNKEIKLQK